MPTAGRPVDCLLDQQEQHTWLKHAMAMDCVSHISDTSLIANCGPLQKGIENAIKCPGESLVGSMTGFSEKGRTKRCKLQIQNAYKNLWIDGRIYRLGDERLSLGV